MIMGKAAGIEYTKDAAGRKHYVRIDLDMYGEKSVA